MPFAQDLQALLNLSTPAGLQPLAQRLVGTSDDVVFVKFREDGDPGSKSALITIMVRTNISDTEAADIDTARATSNIRLGT